MSLRLHVGSQTLIGALERYAARLDLLELSLDGASVPGPQTFQKWRGQVREDFVFSLSLSRDVAALASGPDVERQIARAITAAQTLRARFIVLRTPASVTPSDRNRRRLLELVTTLKGGCEVAWEPRGVWTPEESEAFAGELGVVLVRDLAQSDAPSGPVVYTRLLALGHQARLSQGALERVAERLGEATEAFVVVDGRGAPGVARRLKAELGLDEAPPSGDSEPDDADDEDFEDEDEDSESDDEGADDEE